MAPMSTDYFVVSRRKISLLRKKLWGPKCFGQPGWTGEMSSTTKVVETERERELGLGRGEVVAAPGSWVNGMTVGQGWYDQMRLGPKCSSTWRAELCRDWNVVTNGNGGTGSDSERGREQVSSKIRCNHGNGPTFLKIGN